MPLRALALSLALSALLSAPAGAGSQDDAERTLGILTRAAEAVVFAKVTSASGEALSLEPLRALKGPALGALRAGHELEEVPPPDSKVLAFLSRGEAGWRCLEAIVLASPAEADALRLAVEARLGGRRADLYAQLLSATARVRGDAALDLLAALGDPQAPPALGRARPAPPTAAERALHLRALAEQPTLELLQLSERLAGPDLLPPLLSLARSAPHPLLQATACRALAASDRPAALQALSADLAGAEPARAIRSLGYLGGAEAGALLSRRLAQAEPRTERLRLLCALADCRAAEAATLSAIASSPRHPGEERIALAVLARCAEGRALRALQESLADPSLKDLARGLRRDPHDLARRVLAGAEEELRRLDALAARQGPPEPAEPEPADRD